MSAVGNDFSTLRWIKGGELIPTELKAVVSMHAEKLSSSSLDVQREGAEACLSLINTVWSLETHAARDAADLIAMETRCHNHKFYIATIIIIILCIAFP